MSLDIAQRFVPAYAPVPANMKRSSIWISPRYPRIGTSASIGGQTIGIDGATANYLPVRSDLEIARWGANGALWVYIELAASLGFASPQAYMDVMLASGYPIQGASNWRSLNPTTGPFAKDTAGANWQSNASPARPALVSGSQAPLISRTAGTIDFTPAGDAATNATRIANAVGQIAMGAFGIHQDSPAGLPAIAGNFGITPDYDDISQGAEFSSTAQAGFTTWLLANIATTELDAVGLTGWNSASRIVTWLKANKPLLMFANPPSLQVDPTAVDNYIFRIGANKDPAVRKICTWLGRYLRYDRDQYYAQLRAAMGSALLSPNIFAATPAESVTGCVRTNAGLWSFGIAETCPPYPSEWGGNAVGSSAWFDIRMVQQARHHMYMRSADLCGLHVFHEHKPPAPNAVSAKVVKQTYRQSSMQSVFGGHTPMPPVDVYMNPTDPQDQGVISAFRFWGSPADYGDMYAFIRANAALIDDYEVCATVHLVAHSDSFPDQFASGGTSFAALMPRFNALWLRDVDYHFMVVGTSSGVLPADPVRSVETMSPIIIRVQDDADYYGHLGRLCGGNYRKWSTAAAVEAMQYSPVRSTSPYVRATARYNAAARRVSVHLQNFAVNADGTPKPQTTTLRWNWDKPTSDVTVVRLGEAGGTARLDKGSAQVTLREYAILNFAV